MSRAGVVLGLEVSRLARNNVDWHRLLEICVRFHIFLPGQHFQPPTPRS